MSVLRLAAAMALMIQPVAGQRADDAPLKPAGAWGVDYGENLCTLSRSFGAGEGKVSLGFIPLTGGSPMKIVMIGVPNGGKSDMGTATFSAGTGEALHRPFYTTTDAKTGKPVTLIRAGRGDLAGISGSTVLTIRIKGRHVSFALPGIDAALKALDSCESDLAKTWGYDPAAVATSAKPIGPGRWLTDADYPTTALLRRDAGETDFRLTVGVDGKPTGCVVLLKSGSPALDERTCASMMRKARFQPALGVDGKPVPGLFASSVLWMLSPSQFH